MADSRERKIISDLNYYAANESPLGGGVPGMDYSDVMWCRAILIGEYGWTDQRLREGWPSLFSSK